MINIYLLIIIEAVLIHLCTHLLFPLNLKISKKLKLVAYPGERKIHKIPIPEAGGLCFALPIILAQATFGLFSGNAEMGKMLLELSGVGFLALCFGVWDDRFESPPPYKLVWQICLGVIMYLFGYRVLYLTNPFGEHFILGWLSFPVTVLWYLIVINAINFIDGLDGLACGITIIVSAVLIVIGIKEQNELVIAISSFLLAGNLAFLRYNFYPAKIFMGETGALFIGLNIAAISTAGTSQYKGITSITLMVPLAVMAVPLIDFVLAVFRRLHYRDMFHSDKEHIHHTMLDIGFSSLLIEEKLLPWKATQPEAIAFSIDDESTKDFDDAISFTKDGSFWHLTLYVSSVSERLNLEGALFAEAKKRVSSLYTANAVIPLFPFNHSEQELSLKKDSVRPVLALNIWLDENLAIQHYELSRMNITISENYSFNEIDHQIEQEPFSILYRLSKLLAEKRGVNSFSEKERYYYYISAAEQGLEVKCVDTQSPARKIVEELMILYNSCLADYAVKNNIPVIYRNINQFEDPKDNFLSLQAYLSTEPEFHPGIGANAYLHSTSPIRRYVDLINQLQISAILKGKNPPFSKEELEKDIPLLEKRIYDIREIAHKSERYWVLKFLQQNCINIPLETYFRINIDGYLSFELIPWGFIITAKSESYPKTERCKIVIYKVDPEQGIVWVDII